MKRAVLLHGTDGKPSYHWFPWIKNVLEQNQYEIFAPLLPENHTPNRTVYDKFLRESGWDFQDNLLVGHSSGATTALNLLQSDWFPSVKAVVLVGAFLNEKLTKSVEWYELGQFDNLFPAEFNPELLKQKCQKFYFVHSKDDPYCDYKDAKKLCDQLDGTFIEVKHGGHLSDGWNIKQLPGLLAQLRADNLVK